jgi:hypothetical protein
MRHRFLLQEIKMSGIRISQFKKPKSIIVDQARVDSSYGPKSSILLETLATNFSKNGFTIEVKGLSRDSLLNGMFVTVPIDIKWKANTTQAGLPTIDLIPSEFFDMADPHNNKFGADADANLMQGGGGMRAYDSLCIRPNAFKCIRNATLSINGSSFSTRVDAYYTALCKLFCDGRQEEITGAAYESYPYSNCGDSRQLQHQRGWFERCKNLNSSGRVKHVKYADNPYNIEEVTFAYDIKFPIWFGPFTHLGFPGLTGFDGQTVSSIPYVSDLVLECTFQDDVLMDAFAGPDIVGKGATANAISSCSPFKQPLATSFQTDWAPDTHNMWNTAKASSLGLLPGDAQDVCLRTPKLCYMFSEPDPDKMSLASIYTLPSYRFITYEDRKLLAANQQTVNISFPYIRLSNISSLYICMAEGSRTDVGAAGIASRSGRYSGTNWDPARLGVACANRTCPIKWDTVKVSMSTSSSVLSNFVQNTITEQRQYELFQKYSANAMALTFEQWKQSSQMLLFSAEELCGIGAFANSFQALTLSVSFDVYRDVNDTGFTASDYYRVGTAAGDQGPQWQDDKGKTRARGIIGRLICLEPELVSISEGAVSVEQVKLSQQEIHNQLMSGAPEVEDANRLDTLAR